jgi:glucose-1-phosphatase
MLIHNTIGMGIRTIVFDFGNVIGFFSHRRAAEQLAAYAAVNADVIQAFLFGGRLEDDYESGILDTVAFRAQVRERCRLTCDDVQFDAAYADMFVPNPETCELLPKLRERYRLLLLSNTTDVHSRWFLLQFADVIALFDGVVLSHEVGVRKPDRRIYERCLALAECAAGECLFVDDLPPNVEAARACGWQGIVYQPGGDFVRRLSAIGVQLGSK